MRDLLEDLERALEASDPQPAHETAILALLGRVELASVREEKSLGSLPPGEARTWRTFWHHVHLVAAELKQTLR